MQSEQTPASQETLAQLKEYITHQLRAGLHPDEIHQQLKTAGWQDDAVSQAFVLAQSDVLPSHMATGVPEQATQPQGQLPTYETVKRGRFKTGWLLFQQSIKVLRTNKGLLRYVLMSMLIGVLVALPFIVLIAIDATSGNDTFIVSAHSSQSGDAQLTPAGYAVAFVYYVLAFFVTNLYAAGLVANVLDLFRGQSQPYKHYMQMARARGGTLFMFAVIEASVGLLLRLIAERSRLLVRIVVRLLGAMWSLANLFTVPVIITSNDNAFSAIKRSTKLLISTWGENLVGRVTFGAVYFLSLLLIVLPVSIGLVLLGGAVGGGIGAGICLVIVLFFWLAYGAVMYAASSVLNAALFYYAQFRQIPAAFDPELLNSVFIKRKRRGLLGRKTPVTN
ncbi:MAG TPA: DUF6159 family protein [Candidatus Saccharimonadales bacterium]|nr:DUF6159 family protein [Candidatus Saccharimonadales bacterium]